MLTPLVCSEIVRQRLSLPDDSQAAKIIGQIPTALKAFARKYAADPATRPLVTTDLVSIPIVNGQIDMVTGYDTYQFLLEFFDVGQIYLLPTASSVTADPTNDTITITDHIDDFEDLDKVQFASSITLPTGISALTDYYIYDFVLGVTSATFKISSTADGLTPVNFSTAGTGKLRVTRQNPHDPMQRLQSPQQAHLPRYLGEVFDYFYIQSNTLYVLPSSINGSIAFAVPFYPLTLAGLPDSEEAERAFIDKLVEQCVPMSDVAQDGEK